MTTSAPKPYLLLPGTAREALERYRSIFGGEVRLHTFGEFGRSDGPAEAIAHGVLSGPVSLYAADAGTGDAAFSSTGLFLALLGAVEPEVLHEWFAALGAGGTVLEPLEQRAWNAWDGQVRDAFGVTWLVGYELEAER